VKAPSVKPVRCAVYTRVSTEHGLDQEFNSLDAQHDAASAYIKSQARAGWTLIRSRYDDGGYSGGSTDRPDLQRLLDDVRARKIDVIVVYKVDRLTRSLADFAKLVELFDAHGVSFVSVTQQFNTTTSMGRLTLNVLLSFAQFEREVTSERIRDKIAASKRKGLWVGGNLPLGYKMMDGKIAIVEEEAELVRSIFRRYLELGSVNELLRDSKNATFGPKPGCCPRARRAVGSRSDVARCTTFWLIAFISARSNTRMRSCRVSSLRSWTPRCLRRSGRNRSPAERIQSTPEWRGNRVDPTGLERGPRLSRDRSRGNGQGTRRRLAVHPQRQAEADRKRMGSPFH
jgi:DNA invertase Pin-like site-specific DNA recombinase